VNRLVALGLLGLGVLLLLSGVGYAVYNQAVTHPGLAPLPEQVAGLPLGQKTLGLQAVEEINHMHGKNFLLTSAAVGHYGSHGQVTLWVSGAPLRTIASSMLQAMRDKISEGNSPFIPVDERIVGRRSIYVLDGMGQKHFYYQSNKSIIWLAADPELAEQALDHILEVYP
jgi:hypothetical protein